MKKVGWARRAAIIAGGGGLVLGLVGIQATRASADPGSNGSNSSVGNPYDPANGHPYRHGAIPTREDNSQLKAYNSSHTSGLSTGPEILAYGGGVTNTNGTVVGVTSGTPKVYLVFWGSAWGTETTVNNNDTFANDSYGGAPYIQNLFKGLGTAPSGASQEMWSATMTQYCDGSISFAATTCPTGAVHIGYPTSGGVLAGVWYDNSSEPTTTTATQIAQEAVNAASHFGNTTAASNRYAQYDILSPPGADPDSYLSSNFCAWHDYTGDGYPVSSSAGYLAFTNMPYVMDVGASCGMNFVNSGSAGNLDGYSIVNGHEYAETITDQFPAGGWTNQQNNSYRGEENGDECAWLSSGTGASANVSMSTGTFAMQSTWSNSNNGCILNTDSIVTGGTGSPPSPPTNLSASLNGSSVNLSWRASTGATSYDVLRSTSSSSGFNQIGTSNTTGYTDSPSTSGTYYYEVEAVGSGGTSTPAGPVSETVTVTAKPMTVTVSTGSVSRTRRGFSVPITVKASSSGSALGGASVLMDVYAGSTCSGTVAGSGSGTTSSTTGQVVFNFTTKSASTYCAVATVSKSTYTTTSADSSPFTT